MSLVVCVLMKPMVAKIYEDSSKKSMTKHQLD